ncbi:MAG TPA: hypothetical protein VEQ42_01315, partial [Pyrinomonadaceae bacterium]|nr:hypothetical protein [Pyrinomonadaceae bacterium]
MSRQSSSLLLPRVVLLLAAALAASGCGVIAQQKARTQQPATPTPARPAPSPAEGETIDRATSEPYTGDLSIFESADR